jgi:hypothetical protein
MRGEKKKKKVKERKRKASPPMGTDKGVASATV